MWVAVVRDSFVVFCESQSHESWWILQTTWRKNACERRRLRNYDDLVIKLIYKFRIRGNLFVFFFFIDFVSEMNAMDESHYPNIVYRANKCHFELWIMSGICLAVQVSHPNGVRPARTQYSFSNFNFQRTISQKKKDRISHLLCLMEVVNGRKENRIIMCAYTI